MPLFKRHVRRPSSPSARTRAARIWPRARIIARKGGPILVCWWPRSFWEMTPEDRRPGISYPTPSGRISYHRLS